MTQFARDQGLFIQANFAVPGRTVGYFVLDDFQSLGHGQSKAEWNHGESKSISVVQGGTEGFFEQGAGEG